MAIQERDPRPYELMTVFTPELSEEDTQTQVERVSSYISNAGGNLTETLISSPWGRRRLAYSIRFNGVDYRDGYYTVYHFESAPSNLTELERDLKLDTNTMRYLLVHDDPKAGEKGGGEEGDEAAEGDVTEAAEATASATEQAAEAATADTTASAPTTDEAPAEDAGSEAAAPQATADETPAEAAAEATAGESEAAEATAADETAATNDATESDDESSEKE